MDSDTKEILNDDMIEARTEIMPGIFQTERTRFPVYEKVMIRVVYWMMWIPIVVILLLLAFTFADVISRKFFNAGVSGIYDYTLFSMIVISSLCIVLTTMNDEQVEVTVLTKHFPVKVQFGLALSNFIIVIFYLVMLIRENWNQASVSKMLGHHSLDLPFPTYPFYYLIAAGFFLMLLVVAVKVLNLVRKVK